MRDEKDGDVIQAPIVQRLVLKILSSSRKVTFILGRPNVAGYLRFLNYVHFDLGLDDKGLRIGHWNVNRLSSEKFDQIKLFLIGKSGRAQVDILFLTETLLKPDIPDVLYAVPGFSIY